MDTMGILGANDRCPREQVHGDGNKPHHTGSWLEPGA